MESGDANNKRKVEKIIEEEDFEPPRNEELFQEFESETLQQKKQKKAMPKKGVKAMFPTEESEKIALQKREDWYKQTVQNSVRAQRIKNLSVGIWREDLKLIEIQTMRGKAHNKMGISIKGMNYLRIEEAIFLVDSAHLEIFEDGIPLSIQECYRLIDLDPFLSMEKYLVFSYLNRLGYIVLRYNPSNSNKKSKKINSMKENQGNKEISNSNISSSSKSRGWWPLSEYCGKWKEEENSDKMEEVSDFQIIRKNNQDRIQSYSELQKLESPNWEKWIREDNRKTESLQITYDVYLPQGFKKTTTNPPAWRIIVFKFLDNFPNIIDIHKLLEESDPIPVKFCVVQNGTINFLEIRT